MKMAKALKTRASSQRYPPPPGSVILEKYWEVRGFEGCFLREKELKEDTHRICSAGNPFNFNEDAIIT